jgi:Ran GTPase-activating protein (RanGAP) involved in mRNA processing and transport
MSDLNNGNPLLSSTFLEFCAKVRTNDPSILPEPGKPFMIRHSSAREIIELADALLENTSVTYLELERGHYMKSSAEAMAKYVRTSKRLQRIRWKGEWKGEWYRRLQKREEMVCCFLLAFQESTSLKELDMDSPTTECEPSNLAFENMLKHSQSLRSLHLNFPIGCREDKAVAAASAGLKKNTSLQELTLEFSRRETTIYPLLTSLRDHPLLRKLCLHGCVGSLSGLETLLLSDASKITELEFDMFDDYKRPPIMFLTLVLQALAHRPTLTKLKIHGCRLGSDEARLLQIALCNMPSLHTLVLTGNTLVDADLTELAPALYHNTSIKVLDISENYKMVDSTEVVRGILQSNKTMTALELFRFPVGQIEGAVDRIADGLGSNSTLLKINLSGCLLRDGGMSTLAQILGSRNTTLQKLNLDHNVITSTGIGVLLEAMEQGSHHITDLSLRYNAGIGNEGAALLARSLGNNALPCLTRLSLDSCGIDNDGFMALMSALEQNTSLLQIDLRNQTEVVHITQLTFLALAESLPKIKFLQRIDLTWFPGITTSVVMPILLAGLRKNTSLFRFHVSGYAPSSNPPLTLETASCESGWMQEMEGLGYRNCFLPMVRAPKERLPPRGVWPHALARVAILPDIIFEVLRSKPSLVSIEHTESKEAAKHASVLTKRKRGD